MNERIKLFAELAINAIPAHLGSRVPIEFTEKFAELIVRECAWIANDPAPSVYDHDSYKLGRKFAGIDVLKHFGVEE
jgi:hypothetical protein